MLDIGTVWHWHRHRARLIGMTLQPSRDCTACGGGRCPTACCQLATTAPQVGNLTYVHWEAPPGIAASRNHTVRVYAVAGRRRPPRFPAPCSQRTPIQPQCACAARRKFACMSSYAA